MVFRLGLAQCAHPADGDVLAMADAWMARAKAADVDLLVFPESLMTPFELEGADFAASAEPIDGPFCTGMDALAAKHGLWVVYTANEQGEGAGAQAGAGALPFNTAVMVDDTGSKRAVYRKVHLFDTDFVKESDKVAHGDNPMPVIETPFGKVAVAICYDLRFPEFSRCAAMEGAEVLVYPSAWVDGPRKVNQWRTLLAARAVENELFVAGLSRCDRAFGQAKRDYIGHSCVFSPLGDVLAEAQGIEEELVVANLDLAEVAAARAAMSVLDHRRPDAYR